MHYADTIRDTILLGSALLISGGKALRAGQARQSCTGEVAQTTSSHWHIGEEGTGRQDIHNSVLDRLVDREEMIICLLEGGGLIRTPSLSNAINQNEMRESMEGCLGAVSI